jgi:hypothetical protein
VALAIPESQGVFGLGMTDDLFDRIKRIKRIFDSFASARINQKIAVLNSNPQNHVNPVGKITLFCCVYA